jgi:hypothetical protein
MSTNLTNLTVVEDANEQALGDVQPGNVTRITELNQSSGSARDTQLRNAISGAQAAEINKAYDQLALLKTQTQGDVLVDPQLFNQAALDQQNGLVGTNSTSVVTALIQALENIATHTPRDSATSATERAMAQQSVYASTRGMSDALGKILHEGVIWADAAQMTTQAVEIASQEQSRGIGQQHLVRGLASLARAIQGDVGGSGGGGGLAGTHSQPKSSTGQHGTCGPQVWAQACAVGGQYAGSCGDADVASHCAAACKCFGKVPTDCPQYFKFNPGPILHANVTPAAAALVKKIIEEARHLAQDGAYTPTQAGHNVAESRALGREEAAAAETSRTVLPNFVTNLCQWRSNIQPYQVARSCFGPAHAAGGYTNAITATSVAGTVGHQGTVDRTYARTSTGTAQQMATQGAYQQHLENQSLGNWQHKCPAPYGNSGAFPVGGQPTQSAYEKAGDLQESKAFDLSPQDCTWNSMFCSSSD